MKDLRWVAQIRLRQWRAGTVYWLQVVGVDTKAPGLMNRIYIGYLLAILAGWFVLSWSGLLFLAHQMGSRIATAGLTQGIPVVLYGVAMIWWGAALARLPFLMPHGDLEWMATSPVSRRAIFAGALVPAQAKTAIVSLVLASTVFSGLGQVHFYLASGLTALLVSTVQVVGWALSGWRASVAGPPKRWLWLVPGLMVPLILAWPGAARPFAGALAPLHQGPVPAVAAVELAAWVAAWAWALRIAGHINMVSVASQSATYADLRAARPIIGMGGNAQVLSDVRVKRGMAGRRVRGRVRPWPQPWWELSRFAASALRLPRRFWYLVETAALFRSGLLAVFAIHTLTAWMFWLILAYRFRLNGMAGWYRADTGTPFLRQFWPETDVVRYLRATWIPLAVTTVLSFALWAVLPLSIPVTWLHGLFWFGMIATWYVAEGPLLMGGALAERGLGRHETAVVATGLMLIIGAPLAKPEAALAVPAVLSAVALGRIAQGVVGRRIPEESPTQADTP